MDENLRIVHTTSQPQTDQQAYDYFAFVQRWFPNLKIRYIEKREINKDHFELMDYQYVDGEVMLL